MARVLVAMSGGVDSSVAAALLKEDGHEVTGVTMKVWDGESLPQREAHGCYGPDEDDIEDARSIARILDIPFYVFDLTAEYRAEVLDYVRHEYFSGRTPNPCVRCNRRVKLDMLVEKARDDGIEFEFVATGHYARVEQIQSSGRYVLKKARDWEKDQSYFLYALSQEQLSRAFFPLGDFTKAEVVGMAFQRQLGVAQRAESQDFIAGGYSSIMGTSAQPGLIFDRQGTMLGRHRGIPYYTIGQRKGLGISAKEALYVTEIDCAQNALIVGTKEEVYGNELICSEMNWIVLPDLEHALSVKAKIRYSHSESEAIATPLEDGRVRVVFTEPQMAITPGQAVVFYDIDTVVGGGTIEASLR
ncbi:MAG: tRNA 2-thiouridine(34) synthase MnmA [Chloroflexota bacterium]|nr:tRNA 2-thiouridine(34) synthase MnmA [Chloroflexota bacterium]